MDDDDNKRIAVQCGAGPEAPAWAGQEAADVLEDMTRYARKHALRVITFKYVRET